MTDADPTYTRRTPPAANFSSAAATAAVPRRPPPPPPAPSPPDSEEAPAEADATSAPEKPAPSPPIGTPAQNDADASHVEQPDDLPQTAKPTATAKPPGVARRPRATTAPTQPPAPVGTQAPTGDRRYGFRPVTIGLSPDAMDWFDQQKAAHSSQRALLLELFAEYGSAVVAVADAINARRAQLGLSPTRPPARHGRMVSVNISMHHDEATALDDAADKSGRSRAAYCEELIRLARQARRQD
jgi:hypothetical protein